MSSHGHHDPTVEPFDCCFAALNELAGSTDDRGVVLEHGQRALWELNRRLLAAREGVERLRTEVREARAWAWSEFHREFDSRWLATADAPDLEGGWEWNPPQWLTDPRAPVEQAWLTTPPDVALDTEFEFPPDAESRPAAPDLVLSGEPPVLPRLLDADLNQEDDDGNGWTLVELDAFDPSWLFPGARVDAGRQSGHALVTVLRTELFNTTGGRTVVLVTFDKAH